VTSLTLILFVHIEFELWLVSNKERSLWHLTWHRELKRKQKRLTEKRVTIDIIKKDDDERKQDDQDFLLEVPPFCLVLVHFWLAGFDCNCTGCNCRGLNWLKLPLMPLVGIEHWCHLSLVHWPLMPFVGIEHWCHLLVLNIDATCCWFVLMHWCHFLVVGIATDATYHWYWPLLSASLLPLRHANIMLLR